MKFPSAIIELAEGLKDALAPMRCISCLIEGTWYCSACRHAAPPHILTCIGCKEERPRGATCSACKEDIPLTGVISARSYSDQAIQRGIEWLKFKGVRPIAEILGGILIPKLTAIGPIPYLAQHAVLVPLPLHASRKRSRGFNQSEDIAHAIGSLCKIPVAHLLTKQRSTVSQAKLPHDLRQENTQDAFALTVSPLAYQILTQSKNTIIIVDDVATTGATLISAARAFPPHTAVEIWGATIARG